MKILGDTHSIGKVMDLLKFNKIKNTQIIQVGDFGVGFKSFEKDIETLYGLNKWLGVKGNKLYVCRGNHDNPDFFNKKIELPEFSNLTFVTDYSVLKIDNFKVLFIGGAISIDRVLRREGRDYWANEKLDYDEEKLEKVLAENGDIDIVITHTAPEQCFPRGTDAHIVNYYCKLDHSLRDELEAERIEMARAFEIIIKKINSVNNLQWYYGHFHMSFKETINDVNFTLLNINEMIEV